MNTLTVPTLPPLRRVRSSWLSAVGYLPADGALGEGVGMLFVELRSGALRAYAAPAWVYGLICAAAACGRSVGRMWHRVVKGLPSVRLEVA